MRDKTKSPSLVCWYCLGTPVSSHRRFVLPALVESMVVSVDEMMGYLAGWLVNVIYRTAHRVSHHMLQSESRPSVLNYLVHDVLFVSIWLSFLFAHIRTWLLLYWTFFLPFRFVVILVSTWSEHSLENEDRVFKPVSNHLQGITF